MNAAIPKFSVPLVQNSTHAKTKIHSNETKISKSVFVSQSSDVFTNLALEDWLYRNFDLTNHHVMLLWRNAPCVVIGRHQNPWLEANLGPLAERGIEVARRNSGGGTVYHDDGNLNFTFFTPRERYNRKQNLQLIGQALHREWDLHTKINQREDIVLDDKYKISGTASKLGRPNAYHHCTLLVDVNKKDLSQALHKYDKGITTNATVSTPSHVLNLNEVNPAISVERLITAVGWEYLRTSAISQQDGGWDLVAKQRGFQLVNPTDDWFPGLASIRAEFSSWEWRYGRTPKFHVQRTFALPQGLSGNTDGEALDITIDVSRGLVEDVTLRVPPDLMMADGFVGDVEVLTAVRGCKFTEDSLDKLKTSLERRGRRGDFVADCVRKVMASV